MVSKPSENYYWKMGKILTHVGLSVLELVPHKKRTTSREFFNPEIKKHKNKITELEQQLEVMDKYGIDNIDDLTKRAIDLLEEVNNGKTGITVDRIEKVKNILKLTK